MPRPFSAWKRSTAPIASACLLIEFSALSRKYPALTGLRRFVSGCPGVRRRPETRLPVRRELLISATITAKVMQKTMTSFPALPVFAACAETRSP